jgi:glucan endo-1,3-beta-D-glucosidase
MHAPQSFAAWATLASLASAQIMGFNSGATLDTYKVKVQSDYEAEFTTAQGLVGAPGKFNSVRLYTMIQGGTDSDPTSAFQAAMNTNTTMLLGIWCSGTTTIEKELNALSTAITQYGTKFTDLVVGISVGSEDLYRTSVTGIINKSGIGNTPDNIVKFIKDTRNAIANTPLSGTPIGHVDTWTDWTNSSNKAVIDAVDFLGNDLYAYYESTKNNSIENAADLFNSAYNATLAVAGKKPVWITET